MYKTMKKLLILALISLIMPITVSASYLYEYGSFAERSVLAAKFGIVNNSSEYVGSYEQNIALLGMIEKGGENIGANPFQPSGISVNIRQSLSAGSSRSGTTLNVDPFITLDGRRVTFADFNSTKAFGKIDQGTANEEIISFTGITDNTTYYTLTGVTWGYNFYNNTGDVSANKKKHNSGASFIITNDWHFVDNNYLSIGSDQTVTSVKTFDQFPLASGTLANNSGNLTEFATVDYVNSVATSGVANAQENVAGKVELSTGAEAASSTSSGSTGARLVLPTSISTTTAGTAYTIPVTDSNTRIEAGFYQGNDHTFSGTNILSGTNTFSSTTATTTFSGNISAATSTFSALPTGPSSYPTASTTLANKGYVDALTYYPTTNGVFTKDFSDASYTGTTTITHGLGLTPKKFTLFCNAAAGTLLLNTSYGTYNGTSYANAWAGFSNSTDNSGSNTTNIAYLTSNTATNGRQTATITTFNSTNVVLSWVKNASPTGNAYCMWDIN